MPDPVQGSPSSQRRRDRPPALDFHDKDLPISRPVSASSSLDPYYFGFTSDSPPPPLPPSAVFLENESESSPAPASDPTTPARDPATIDRGGLIGVGELTTPRWTRGIGGASSASEEFIPISTQLEELDIVIPQDIANEDEDEPDSPWTIEAIDGEFSEPEELLRSEPPTRPLRLRPSLTEESGGEEIVYPRQPSIPVAPVPVSPKLTTPKSPLATARAPRTTSQARPSPPITSQVQVKKARKRASDDLEKDHAGSFLSRQNSTSTKKEETPSARKHRSLSSTISSSSSPSGKKDRPRDSTGLTLSSSLKITQKSERHSRHSSTSSANALNGRVPTSDFSHLPPSPSSSSIQQFLRSPGNTSNSPLSSPVHSAKEIHPHPPASAKVAHSLLRGTQEGWSGLDDEATAEALRKLDGLGGKNARSRVSIASVGRPLSMSRPSTPPTRSGGQWEGVPTHQRPRSKYGNVKDDTASAKDDRILQDDHIISTPDMPEIPATIEALGTEPLTTSTQGVPVANSPISPSAEKTPKKSGTTSARSSLAAKRGSASSTNYTSTPSTTASSRDSRRDSAGLPSASTSVTSVSALSGRHSKTRRNSAGSDSSIHSHSGDALSLRDRVASLALTGVHNGEQNEELTVPPVPPLPKDLSNYRSPPSTSASLTFPPIPLPDKQSSQENAGSKSPTPKTENGEVTTVPTLNISDREDKPLSEPADLTYQLSTSLPAPSHLVNPVITMSEATPKRQSQLYSPLLQAGVSSDSGVPYSQGSVTANKTPSKKWSFSNALNLKLSSSPSSKTEKDKSHPLSPRSVSFGGGQLRKSVSKDKDVALSSSMPWSPPMQQDGMHSAASLNSISSVGSVTMSGLPPTATSKTPDRSKIPSRSGTDSSASITHHTTPATFTQGPLSPTSSVRRSQSKRLTPSSIPFFRRSSSQSMQPPLLNTAMSGSSPTLANAGPASATTRLTPSAADEGSRESLKDSHASSATTTPHKKSSMLSLGLPSLLKSSSRKSLNADSKEAAKDIQRAREAAEKEKEKKEKEKKGKEKSDWEKMKDRSDSRISVLMGRKRGKTLSSTDPQKPKDPVHMPPLQISAIDPPTAQRVARLKNASNSSLSSSSPTSTASLNAAKVTSSRLTSQTVSSLQKQSDASLRATRHQQLPTIAGSPSVGTLGHAAQDNKDVSGSLSGLPKETPTKIPRISSRTSAAASPPLKGSNSNLTAARRTSILVSSTNASPTGLPTNEFGVMENGDINIQTKATKPPSRGSPSTTSTTRLPRQSSISGTTLPRKSNRDSVSFGLRKSSAGSAAPSAAHSIASASDVANTSTSVSHHHRFSALSPSRGLKLLSPKISLGSRSSAAQNAHQSVASPSSSRQSLSTPSPSPSSIDDEELLGDEEMMGYIRRQQAKKMAAGASQAELDQLLRFPEPFTPAQQMAPSGVLKSSQSQYLSEYEKKEILDFPAVFYFGAKSKKKNATPENSANNFGYDDERGDYQVIIGDHLAYRYEVTDTLGKGSFGQVLQCRDHCTGESVAIKIIRNKKRFHHQALVEIKILDNLRKWDNDDKHHVIKMTEHFYFRNHLCIAMELLSINLYELIKANGFVGFTTALIRRFTSQMLLSLSLMRHHRIVHCDLKPENVLLRHPTKSAIKVIDFGSSCFEHEKIYTYIQSRFYRSPEVILGMNYHMAIDMWSLGCILAELYTGVPIFPGENEQEQLACIMEVLGQPDKEFINRSSRKKLFFDPSGQPRPVVNSKGRRRKPGSKNIAQALRSNDEEFVDFISKCLVWDPERRLKPQAALRHPFVTAGRKPKPPSTPKSTLSSSTLGSRRKEATETPKKSLISAPTPLTARSSRTTSGAAAIPGSSSHTSITNSTSRSFRTSQSQGLSSHHSNRTLSGYVAAK